MWFPINIGNLSVILFGKTLGKPCIPSKHNGNYLLAEIDLCMLLIGYLLGEMKSSILHKLNNLFTKVILDFYLAADLHICLPKFHKNILQHSKTNMLKLILTEVCNQNLKILLLCVETT